MSTQGIGGPASVSPPPRPKENGDDDALRSHPPSRGFDGFAANFDERCVEMDILSDTGETISVTCPSDSIFAIQRHIKQLGDQYPEIATWGRLSREG